MRRSLVGLGNAWRCDDSVGLLVARAFIPYACDDLQVTAYEGDVTGLIELWEGVGDLVVVDAMQSGRSPGEWLYVDLISEPLPDMESQVSTHGLGLREAIELAVSMGCFPARAGFFGIEGRSFDRGQTLTDGVSGAMLEVVAAIEKKWKL